MHALVNTPDALLLDDAGDSVGEAAELGVGRPLIVDELDFDGLHRGHGQHGLRNAGSEATEKPGNIFRPD